VSVPDLHRRLLVGCAFLAVFVALDYLSYVQPYRGLGVTPWNPPPGLSVALMFLGGSFFAPFVLVAPALADYVVRGTPLGFAQSILAAAATGAPYLAAGIILQRLRFFDPRLRSVQDAITLITLGVASVTVSAILFVSGLLALQAIERDEVLTVAWRAGIGDLIGMLVVVPLALLAWTDRPWPVPTLSMLGQAGAIVASLLIVFGYQEATAFQLFYVLFLPVLWVALTYGPLGSALALLLVQVGILIGAEIRFLQ
jgi:two-component system, LuxR family, sensor kinase FixL